MRDDEARPQDNEVRAKQRAYDQQNTGAMECARPSLRERVQGASMRKLFCGGVSVPEPDDDPYPDPEDEE